MHITRALLPSELVRSPWKWVYIRWYNWGILIPRLVEVNTSVLSVHAPCCHDGLGMYCTCRVVATFPDSEFHYRAN